MADFDIDLTLQDCYDAQVEFEEGIEKLNIAEDFADLQEEGNLDEYTQEAMIQLGNDELSTEGIVYDATKTVVRQGSKLVGQAIEKGWGLSKELYDKTFISVSDLKEELSALEKKINVVYGDPKNSEIVLKRESVTLALAYNLPRDSKDILKALNAIESDSNIVLDYWSKKVDSTGKQLLRAIDKYSKKEPEECLKLMLSEAKDLSFNDLQKKLKMRSVPSNWFSSIEAYGAQELPGSKMLISLRPDEDVTDNDTVIKQSKAYRRRQLKLMDSKSNGKIRTSKVKIDTLSKSEMLDIIKAAKALVEVLETYEKSGLYNSMKNTGERMHSKVEKTLFSLMDRKDAKNRNAIHHFVSSYLKWASVPHSSLMSQAIASVRAATMVCKRSISEYD